MTLYIGLSSIPDMREVAPHKRGGEMIKFFRKKMGMNQQELAQALVGNHVTRLTVMKWENGETQIPLGPHTRGTGDFGGRFMDVFNLEWGHDTEAFFHIINASNQAIAEKKGGMAINNAESSLGSHYAGKNIPDWLQPVTQRSVR